MTALRPLKAWLLMLAALGLLGALAPAEAASSTATSSSLEGVEYLNTSEVALPATNGYRITVTGFDIGGKVNLRAQRHGEEVQYIAEGKVTPTRIDASFGRLGKVSLDFHPFALVRRIRVGKRCPAVRPSVVEAQLGTFVGTVKFKGENDYTSVLAGPAVSGSYGRLVHRLKDECKAMLRAEKLVKGWNPVLLYAGAPIPNGTLLFSASSAPPLIGPGFTPSFGAGPNFEALASEKTEGLTVFRTVVASSSGAFNFDSTLDSATVSPPGPFSGVGAFQRNSEGSTTWMGSLGVSIPGLGPVPLAGSNFKSNLAMASASPVKSGF